MNINELLADLAPFSDLGEDPISGTMADDAVVIRLVRHGISSTLAISDGGVSEITSGDEKRFKTLAALLSSPRYADLPLWADRQRSLLGGSIARETLTITGHSDGATNVNAVEKVNRLLVEGKEAGKRNTIVVIDGPAGVGKTAVVRRLTYERAANFRLRSDSLILHVESRGRVLQNIADLMAYSLQSLRLGVTFDQIPTLVKYGLITLAIDGFDELGDPNGYDLAWAQLNDLILSVQGQGSFILSGRETFVSVSRIQKALPAVNLEQDTMATFTVTAVSPTVARAWLGTNGWSDEALNAANAEPLFERGSYALRPFFLSQLASKEIADDVSRGTINDTLTFLIELMLDREQRKFGRDVEVATEEAQRLNFITDLMEEVARDLAENQTDAISAETLSWLSDAVSSELPSGVRGILRNRADVVAFLTNDDRRGYRKFVHEEVESFFLANSILKTVSNGEIPKYVRRNIFGLDLLENFAETIRYKSVEIIESFLDAACQAVVRLPDQDRSKRNLASLVLAALFVSDSSTEREITDVSMDEAFLCETLPSVRLKRVTIGQLDARGADIRQVKFDNSAIVTLIADSGTVPSQSVPTPAILVLPTGTLTRREDIEQWFAQQYFENVSDFPEFSLTEAVGNYPIFKLLARLTRYRPFWLKDGDEKAARRILDDERWPILRNIMLNHGFLAERNDVPAAGRPSTFYHVRNREALINMDLSEDHVRRLFRDLIATLRE